MTDDPITSKLKDEVKAWLAGKNGLPQIDVIKTVQAFGGGNFSTVRRQERTHWHLLAVWPDGSHRTILQTFRAAEAERCIAAYRAEGLKVTTR